jgi:hypothetical protein
VRPAVDPDWLLEVSQALGPHGLQQLQQEHLRVLQQRNPTNTSAAVNYDGDGYEDTSLSSEEERREGRPMLNGILAAVSAGYEEGARQREHGTSAGALEVPSTASAP